MGVKAKTMSLDIMTENFNLEAFDFNQLFQVARWICSNKLRMVHIQIDEVVEWDMSKMRAFFHGVVIPAFVKKFNETTGAGQQVVFTREIVKDFLKAKFLGYVRDEAFARWNPVLNLVNRPVDMADFLAIQVLFKEHNPLTLTETKSLSPERYWNLLNTCESYFLQLFQDMYDIRQKPQAPKTIPPKEDDPCSFTR